MLTNEQARSHALEEQLRASEIRASEAEARLATEQARSHALEEQLRASETRASEAEAMLTNEQARSHALEEQLRQSEIRVSEGTYPLFQLLVNAITTSDSHSIAQYHSPSPLCCGATSIARPC